LQIKPGKLVLVAARTLPPGTALARSDLGVKRVAAALIPGGIVYHKQAELIEGRRIIRTIAAGEPVAWSALAEADLRVSRLIPKDMRLLAVPIDNLSTMRKFLSNDDRVDLMFTAAGKKAERIVTNIAIVNDLYGDDAEPDNALGFIVPDRQAKEIIDAQKHGSLSILLRNPDAPTEKSTDRQDHNAASSGIEILYGIATVEE
jgi:Flp pilus assembly protein CpaB